MVRCANSSRLHGSLRTCLRAARYERSQYLESWKYILFCENVCKMRARILPTSTFRAFVPQGLLSELAKCLLESDCHQKLGKSVSECARLNSEEYGVPEVSDWGTTKVKIACLLTDFHRMECRSARRSRTPYTSAARARLTCASASVATPATKIGCIAAT